MKAGKLSEAVLDRSVLRQLHSENSQVALGPGIGHDYGLVREGGRQAVSVAAMPWAGSLPELTIYSALNNLVCSGAEPVGIVVSLLLPTSANEQQLRDLMGRIDRVCQKEGIAVISGHTEIVRTVTEPTLTVMALGNSERVSRADRSVVPGMDVIMTGAAGQSGAAILARFYEPQLRERYAQPFIDKAKKQIEYLSVRSEAAVAAQSGAVMHDISEGGVYGALWEISECWGVGLEIDLKKIPIRQETIEVSELLTVNPYKLLSTGALLIVAADGNSVVTELERAGSTGIVIGRTMDNHDKVLLCEDERRFLETTQTDEIWTVIK